MDNNKNGLEFTIDNRDKDIGLNIYKTMGRKLNDFIYDTVAEGVNAAPRSIVIQGVIEEVYIDYITIRGSISGNTSSDPSSSVSGECSIELPKGGTCKVNCAEKGIITAYFIGMPLNYTRGMKVDILVPNNDYSMKKYVLGISN